MKSTPAEIRRILSVLKETPARLAEASAGYPPAILAAAPDQKTWSAQEILAHLRACSDLWTHSIYAMLAQKTPELPDIDERKWARAARTAEIPYKEALICFRLQRSNLVRVLQELEPEMWERDALIAGRNHTVFTQARRLAKHETEHSQQIEALLKTNSGSSAGNI